MTPCPGHCHILEVIFSNFLAVSLAPLHSSNCLIYILSIDGSLCLVRLSILVIEVDTFDGYLPSSSPSPAGTTPVKYRYDTPWGGRLFSVLMNHASRLIGQYKDDFILILLLLAIDPQGNLTGKS